MAGQAAKRVAKAPPGAKAERDLVAAALHGAAHATGQLGTQTLQQFLPYLHQAQQELTKELRQWTTNHAGETFTAQKLRMALAQVNRAMDKGTQLAPAMMAALRAGGKQVKFLAQGALEKELIALAPDFMGLTGQLPIRIAGAIATQDHLLLKRHATSSTRYAGQVRDDVTRALVVAQLKGETISEVTARLMNIPGQVFGKAKFKAERLARTELAHAYNAYHHAGIVEAHAMDDGIVMRWDASLDGRVCGGCYSLHGRVVEVTGSFKAEWAEGKRPVVMTAKHPPLHPNCRCVITPWRQDWGKGPAHPADQAVYDRMAAEKAAAAEAARQAELAAQAPKPKVPRQPGKVAARKVAKQQAALQDQVDAGKAAQAKAQAEAAAQAKAAAEAAAHALAEQAKREQEALAKARAQAEADARAAEQARKAAAEMAEHHAAVARIQAAEAERAAARKAEADRLLAEKKAGQAAARQAKKAGVVVPKPFGLGDIEARVAKLDEIILQKKRDLIGRNPKGLQAQMVKENLVKFQREKKALKLEHANMAKAAGWKPPVVAKAPKPAAAPVQVGDHPLATGKVVSQKALGGGINGSYIIEVEGASGHRQKAVWKPVTGESGAGRSIKVGTYYKREAAASSVADMLGVGDLVPTTVVREHKGVLGSVQEFKANRGRLPYGEKYTKHDADRMRAFDYIIGNTDRHGGNVLTQTGTGSQGRKPVLIDHGLCFPRRLESDRFIQPGGHHDGPLDPKVVAHARQVDPKALAEKLHEAGIEPEATRATLERLRYLQQYPTALEAQGDSGGQWDKPRFGHTIPEHLRPHDVLADKDMKAIDDIMRATTGSDGRRP